MELSSSVACVTNVDHRIRKQLGTTPSPVFDERRHSRDAFCTRAGATEPPLYDVNKCESFHRSVSPSDVTLRLDSARLRVSRASP